MSNTFEVVFKGQVIEGFDENDTRAKIGKLFNADEAKIARLFSGNNVVIKKDLDQATANKYISAFKNAGAIAIVRDSAAAQPATPAVTSETETPAAEAPPAQSAATNSSIVFEHSGEASAHLAPAPKSQIQLDSNPDLSELSLRENTGNLVDPSAEVPEADIDTSEFSLAEAGSDLVDKKEEPAPLNTDLSGISLVDE